MNRNPLIYILILSFYFWFFISCDTSKLNKIPIEKFVGLWEIHGRPIFDGIKLRIEKNENGELTGKVFKLNENKYVKMFVDSSNTWVSDIKQSSNFEFKLTEKKIGSELFAIYGQESTKEYNVQFIDDNTFGLATGNSDPTKSTIIYKRVKE
jgi:hypothetical protein